MTPLEVIAVLYVAGVAVAWRRGQREAMRPDRQHRRAMRRLGRAVAAARNRQTTRLR